MKKIVSKTFATHILDLNKHFHQLQIDLKHWSLTPDDLLTGISVIFPDFPPLRMSLFNVNDTDGEPQEHGDVTIEVISLICTHLYLTVSRLMKNSYQVVVIHQTMKPSDKNPFLYRNIIERVRKTLLT